MLWVDPDTHGWLFHPKDNSDWDKLLERFASSFNKPLAQVFSVARDCRCQTVVDENRYVDADYRSEYSAFWSLRFSDTPAFTRRLHFFRRRLSEDDLYKLPSEPGYIGYSILRPTPRGRVGRTIISPPKRFQRATLALVDDEVSLFGNTLKVSGIPFCEQDGQFIRCAQAATWMCHYSAFLRRNVGRQTSAILAQLSPTMLSENRALPSLGMNVNQIQTVFGETGQPALFYGLNSLPNVRGVEIPKPKSFKNGKSKPPGLWDTRIFSIICRYLNSGVPVLITTHDHAFVLVGWFREQSRIRYIACDDQWGPYELVMSPFTDRRAPWKSLMIPLPPKVFLSGETAENAAYISFQGFGKSPYTNKKLETLAQQLTNNEVSLRTFLKKGKTYKSSLLNQHRDGDTVRMLRYARLSHWVWIVEAHDRQERQAGRPSVIGEFVFDATSGDNPKWSAASLPGASITRPPDSTKAHSIRTDQRLWQSQLHQ